MLCAIGVTFVAFGCSYASVPLYQIFCRVYGLGNSYTTYTPKETIYELEERSKISKELTLNLCAENTRDLPWTLKPCVPKITIFPGDTSLIFYLAHNLSEEAITGVATYNITPSRAGIYFNKIQCFCFEEQRLRGHESVELPILFYIDHAFIDDPKIQDIDTITLSYTFYRL